MPLTNPKGFGTYFSSLQRTMLNPRSLRVSTTTGHDVTFLTVVPTDQPNGGRQGTTISSEDAVELATRLLEEYAPDRLRPRTFNDTVPGTFIQHLKTGQVAKVVAWDAEKFPGWEEDGANQHEVFAVSVTGEAFVAWNDPAHPDFHWRVVEVGETTQTVWTVNSLA